MTPDFNLLITLDALLEDWRPLVQAGLDDEDVRKAAPDFALTGWALHMTLRNGDRNALSKPIARRLRAPASAAAASGSWQDRFRSRGRHPAPGIQSRRCAYRWLNRGCLLPNGAARFG